MADEPDSTRKNNRAPVKLKIKFRSATLAQFIERYSVDVSKGGIFIRTKDPLEVGTKLRFEFQLQDGSPLIVGEGTVVWIREHDPSRKGVAPGMGVRFDSLQPESQEILNEILNRKSGGAPKKGEELVKAAAAAAAAPTPAAVPADSEKLAKAADEEAANRDAAAAKDEPAEEPAEKDEPAEEPAEKDEPAAEPAEKDEPAAEPAEKKEPAKPADKKEPAEKPTAKDEPAEKPADKKEPAKPADKKEPAKPADKKEPAKPAPATVDAPAKAPEAAAKQSGGGARMLVILLIVILLGGVAYFLFTRVLGDKPSKSGQQASSKGVMTQPEPMQPEDMRPEPMQPEDMRPEPMQPEDMRPEPMQPEVKCDKGELVLVESKPEGAKVFLDDKDTGVVTPGKVCAAKGNTRKTVRLEKALYRPGYYYFRQPKDGKLEVITLKPITYRVMIRTYPKRADVYTKGLKLVSTASVYFEPGDTVIKVKISKRGYEDHELVLDRSQIQWKKKRKHSFLHAMRINLKKKAGAEEPVSTMRPEPMEPEAMRPEPMRAEPMRPKAMRPEPMRTEPMRPKAMRPEPMRVEPMRPKPMRPRGMDPGWLKPQ